MSGVIETADCSLTLDGGVAVLTFRRDEVRNTLSGTRIVDDIVRTVEWANGHDEVAVLVLTGSGRAFCAGGDIKRMQRREGALGGDAGEIEAYYRSGIQRLPRALDAAEMPTIAAVNGPAIGAGCDLAAMCDLRIASDDATFGETFINLGLVPGDGGGWFLQRLLGYQRAAEMIFSGRVLDAAEALRIGLVLEVVEGRDLMARTLALAGQMAQKPRQALRYAKRLLKKAERMTLHDYLDLSASWQAVCHRTDDHMEAVDALIRSLSKPQGR